MAENQKLREAVFIVLEGFTLDYNVRKILEAAYYRPEPPAATEQEPTGMPELPEPDSYEFQHEETGNTMFVDRQQVEWGFEKNNPRLQKIAGAYTTSQMRSYGKQCWKAGYKHGAWAQVDDINVAESFTSVTKTAPPVGERDLPPLPDPTYIYHDAEQGEDDLFEFSESGAVDEGCAKCKRLYTADQMRAYARAALSAGDAVDAQRYRWLREQSDDDFAFAVVKNPHFDVYESPEELDTAIDAALRKGQL